MLTTQTEVRRSFWEAHPTVTTKRGPRGRILPQNEQPCDTRMAFCDYVESLRRDGQISEALANRVTL
jgi:hypothetical protein